MQKIIGQLVICALFIVYLYGSGVGTEIYVPFGGGMTWDLGVLFIPFCVIAVLATVNGVNLTDGLDGLCRRRNSYSGSIFHHSAPMRPETALLRPAER